MKDVLYLILARAGSKGVPGKNIRSLGGKPLFVYRIEAAKKSKFPADIVISTDSPEYAELAQAWGAEAPFLRPEFLSNDQAKSVDAISHAVEFLKKQGREYSYICLIEPTSPFTKIEWVDEAIEKMKSIGAGSLVACKYTSPHPAFIQNESSVLDKVGAFIGQSATTNRQELHPQITPSGNFYILTPKFLSEQKSLYSADTLAFMIPEPYCLEIDREIDFVWAEFLLEKKLVPEFL